MAKKQQPFDTENYITVGRLTWDIAKIVHVKAANIRVNKNYIKHVQTTHTKELQQLGIDAETYIKMIADNFTEIRQGTGTSLLLIVYIKGKGNVAAIELNYSTNKKFWEIKTAQPRSRAVLSKKDILWNRCYMPK